MKYWVLFLICWLAPTVWSQMQQQTVHQVVVSAQMQGGVLVYRVNGSRVEDTRKNSLLNRDGLPYEDATRTIKSIKEWLARVLAAWEI